MQENRKKGKKRELNFIEQHNIIVLSKNVKQSSQSKLADWLLICRKLYFLQIKRVTLHRKFTL